MNKNACGGLAWHGEENFFAFQFLNCSTQQHHNAEAGEQTQKNKIKKRRSIRELNCLYGELGSFLKKQTYRAIIIINLWIRTNSRAKRFLMFFLFGRKGFLKRGIRRKKKLLSLAKSFWLVSRREKLLVDMHYGLHRSRFREDFLFFLSASS